MTQKKTVHPYIPNSAPEVKAQMLRDVDASSTEAFYADVPAALRFQGLMDLPEPFLSEYALRRHVEGLLRKNTTTQQVLNFLGAGCYQHYVPAICDEVNQRGEFLTAYAGEPYDDHGRFQSLFEYCSMMGELLEMDVVNVPNYDGFQATATALRMACRITSRRRVLLAAVLSRDKLSRVRDYLKPEIEIVIVEHDPKTGGMDLKQLEILLKTESAAVYFENPSYLGCLETHGTEITDLAHKHKALAIVSVDPISLGVLAPPVRYGADIVCGDIQPLGMHMQFGGGQAGFIASQDDEKIVMQYPSRLFGISPTRVPGEYGFGDVAYDRTSFAKREEGKEWVGTAAALWGITAGVYLALMGPQGMKEIGEGILYRTRYAMQEIGKIKGVCTDGFSAPHFKEFVVNFDGTGRKVSELNAALLRKGIFGGKDLSREFPWLGESALVCVTEVHTQEDIDRLVSTLKEVLS
ncbi:MAG: aminomethyl-transferring glycine dehydrogenase subunit GcvPA [Chloroflexi bacterium]|nr:aminomethyl-transferring glycine dehydrogenase subunit GcvPA [Chloroflexota bacterium]